MDSLEIRLLLDEPGLERVGSLDPEMCHSSGELAGEVRNAVMRLLPVVDEKTTCHVREVSNIVGEDDITHSLRSLYLSSFHRVK